MTEHQHQVDFFKWFRFQYPNVFAYAIPNAAKRSKTLAAYMKAEGLVSGVPDIFIADGRPGMFIEMKKPKTGRLSPNQKAAIQKLMLSGYAVSVCYGWEEAKNAVQDYFLNQTG